MESQAVFTPKLFGIKGLRTKNFFKFAEIFHDIKLIPSWYLCYPKGKFDHWIIFLKLYYTILAWFSLHCMIVGTGNTVCNRDIADIWHCHHRSCHLPLHTQIHKVVHFSTDFDFRKPRVLNKLWDLLPRSYHRQRDIIYTHEIWKAEYQS